MKPMRTAVLSGVAALLLSVSQGAVVLRAGAPTPRAATTAQSASQPDAAPPAQQQHQRGEDDGRDAVHSGAIHAALSQLRSVSKINAASGRYALAQLSSRLMKGGLPGDQTPHLAGGDPSLTYEEMQQEEQAAARQEVLIEIISLLASLIYFGLVYLLAKYYLSHREEAYAVPLEEGAGEEDFKEFRAGLCRCYQRPDICLWTWCCPWIRWGDSMWTMGIFRSFWFALVLFFAVQTMVNNTMDGMGIVVMAIVGAGYRQELREKFQMARQGGVTYFEDFCLYCWCMCCTVAQEARQVEEAVRAGHPAVARKASEAAMGAP